MRTIGVLSGGYRPWRSGAPAFTAGLVGVLLMVGGCGAAGLSDLLNAITGDGIVREPLPPGGEGVAPNVLPESYGVLVGETLSVSPSDGVLANDRHVEALVGFTPITEQGGLIDLRLDGGFTYAPPPGFVGSDYFEYDVRNAVGDATGRVLLKVLAADSAPVP